MRRRRPERVREEADGVRGAPARHADAPVAAAFDDMTRVIQVKQTELVDARVAAEQAERAKRTFL